MKTLKLSYFSRCPFPEVLVKDISNFPSLHFSDFCLSFSVSLTQTNTLRPRSYICTHTKVTSFKRSHVFCVQVLLLAICLQAPCLVKLHTGRLSQRSQFGLQGATPGLAGCTLFSLQLQISGSLETGAAQQKDYSHLQHSHIPTSRDSRDSGALIGGKGLLGLGAVKSKPSLYVLPLSPFFHFD